MLERRSNEARPMKDSGPTPDAPSGASARSAALSANTRRAPKTAGVHSELRDLVAHVLDRWRLPGLRTAVAADPMSAVRADIAAPAVVPRAGGQRGGPGARGRAHRHLSDRSTFNRHCRLQERPHGHRTRPRDRLVAQQGRGGPAARRTARRRRSATTIGRSPRCRQRRPDADFFETDEGFPIGTSASASRPAEFDAILARLRPRASPTAATCTARPT